MIDQGVTISLWSALLIRYWVPPARRQLLLDCTRGSKLFARGGNGVLYLLGMSGEVEVGLKQAKPKTIITALISREFFREAGNVSQVSSTVRRRASSISIWDAFKSAKMFAQQQWRKPVGKYFYQLDFAIFCNKGRIDVEADGDTWRAQRDRIDKDNKRNNDLEKRGWHVRDLMARNSPRKIKISFAGTRNYQYS